MYKLFVYVAFFLCSVPVQDCGGMQGEFRADVNDFIERKEDPMKLSVLRESTLQNDTNPLLVKRIVFFVDLVSLLSGFRSNVYESEGMYIMSNIGSSSVLLEALEYKDIASASWLSQANVLASSVGTHSDVMTHFEKAKKDSVNIRKTCDALKISIEDSIKTMPHQQLMFDSPLSTTHAFGENDYVIIPYKAAVKVLESLPE